MEIRSYFAWFTLAAVAFSFVGCTADRFTYDSPAHRPTTLTVVNALDESQELWKMDIPEGTKLVVEFNVAETGYDDAVFGYVNPDVYPTRMNYYLYPISSGRFLGLGGYYTSKTLEDGVVDLPAGVATKMLVSYRMRKAIFEEVDDPAGDPLSQNTVETQPTPVAEMPSGDGVVLRAQ